MLCRNLQVFAVCAFIVACWLNRAKIEPLAVVWDLPLHLVACQCRSVTGAMALWNSPLQGAQQQPSNPAATAAAAAGKATNTAVAAVSAAYNDKCKPAHEAAVQASLAVASVRSALTAYLRQGGEPQHQMTGLAELQPAEPLPAGNSYRYDSIRCWFG